MHIYTRSEVLHEQSTS